MKRPRLYSEQERVKAEAARFNVLDCGARWGKNVLLRDLMIGPILAGFPVAWFAPTYRMLESDWRALKFMLEPITLDKDEQEHRVVIMTGGSVDMLSLDAPDNTRGRRYKTALVNEAAQVATLKDSWEHIIRERLTDFEGDAWFASTPRGHNFFFTLWQRGQDRKAWPDWRSWRYPTVTNPYISKAEIEAARMELPERVFSQEYLADFIENEGAVFRNIAACLHAPGAKPEEHEGHGPIMGADWGKQNDFTALSIVCPKCKCELAHDRFNKIDYHFQRERLVSMITEWHVDTLVPERNSIGDPIIEEVGRDPAMNDVRIVPFDTLPSTKPQLIENLALAFERAECQWLDDPVWTGELEAYARKMSAITGRSQYSAPEGMHDDTVVARALAWSEASRGPGVLFGV